MKSLVLMPEFHHNAWHALTGKAPTDSLLGLCLHATHLSWLHAGKAHDVMALKCRGADSPLNFAMDEYAELLPMLAKLSKARLRPACPCSCLIKHDLHRAC